MVLKKKKERLFYDISVKNLLSTFIFKSVFFCRAAYSWI